MKPIVYHVQKETFSVLRQKFSSKHNSHARTFYTIDSALQETQNGTRASIFGLEKSHDALSASTRVFVVMPSDDFVDSFYCLSECDKMYHEYACDGMPIKIFFDIEDSYPEMNEDHHDFEKSCLFITCVFCIFLKKRLSIDAHPLDDFLYLCASRNTKKSMHIVLHNTRLAVARDLLSLKILVYEFVSYLCDIESVYTKKDLIKGESSIVWDKGKNKFISSLSLCPKSSNTIALEYGTTDMHLVDQQHMDHSDLAEKHDPNMILSFSAPKQQKQQQRIQTAVTKNATLVDQEGPSTARRKALEEACNKCTRELDSFDFLGKNEQKMYKQEEEQSALYDHLSLLLDTWNDPFLESCKKLGLSDKQQEQPGNHFEYHGKKQALYSSSFLQQKQNQSTSVVLPCIMIDTSVYDRGGAYIMLRTYDSIKHSDLGQDSARLRQVLFQYNSKLCTSLLSSPLPSPNKRSSISTSTTTSKLSLGGSPSFADMLIDPVFLSAFIRSSTMVPVGSCGSGSYDSSVMKRSLLQYFEYPCGKSFDDKGLALQLFSTQNMISLDRQKTGLEQIGALDTLIAFLEQKTNDSLRHICGMRLRSHLTATIWIKSLKLLKEGLDATLRHYPLFSLSVRNRQAWQQGPGRYKHSLGYHYNHLHGAQSIANDDKCSELVPSGGPLWEQVARLVDVYRTSHFRQVFRGKNEECQAQIGKVLVNKSRTMMCCTISKGCKCETREIRTGFNGCRHTMFEKKPFDSGILYFVLDLVKGVYYQKCWKPSCTETPSKSYRDAVALLNYNHDINSISTNQLSCVVRPFRTNCGMIRCIPHDLLEKMLFLTRTDRRFDGHQKQQRQEEQDGMLIEQEEEDDDDDDDDMTRNLVY
jgi:hypothetical protein